MTQKQIEFYLDFSSPYAYIASGIIDEFAEKHDAAVIWRPFVLGAVFKDEGNKPLLEYPKKGAYAKCDIPRCAQFYKVPYHHPTLFPVSTISGLRAHYGIELEHGADAAKIFAKALYAAYFIHNRNISDKDIVLQIGAEVGYDSKWLDQQLQSAPAKDRLRAITDDAMNRGVFGAPYFFINGEPFWGVDRLPMMAHYLKKGTWSDA
ncbi:MAG: 2-hydroxychromene-2-carboxylate isomerase [Alphaproteobacteria bacterium]